MHCCMGLYYGFCVFASITTRMHGTSCYGVEFSLLIHALFSVVKYLYIVLRIKHFGPSLMLFASIIFFFYHMILLKIINMQPCKEDTMHIIRKWSTCNAAWPNCCWMDKQYYVIHLEVSVSVWLPLVTKFSGISKTMTESIPFALY